MGLHFEIRQAMIQEIRSPGESPKDFVTRLALEKAGAIEGEGNTYILAADTIVTLDGAIFGKPKDYQEAYQILETLSGKTHQVLTGYTILKNKAVIVCGVETSIVCFRVLHQKEIEAYVNSQEPMDKAGAYAIQGGAKDFVVSYTGSVNNIIGLPTETLEPWFRKLDLLS